MRPLLISLYLACLLLGGLPAWAATPRFEPIGEPGALRDNIVSALALDTQGFLWLGTPDGAFRYDGYALQRYPLTGTPDLPVPDQFTRALLADRRGGLWMSAGGSGLAWLDPASGHWTRWRRAGAVLGEGVPASDAISTLAQEADGRLWLGTVGAGLDSLDPARRRFSHHRAADSGLPDDRINALLVDRRGTLWIGTWQGLARKPAGSERIEALDLGLHRQRISLLAETADGRILVGTGDGELRMLAADGSERPFSHREGESRWPMLSMVQVSEDELWIGHGGGVERRRASDGALIESLSPASGNPLPVPYGEARALLRDPAGTVWASSFGGGLMRHLPPLPGLRLLRHEGERWRTDGELDVRSALQLRSGEVWLGTQSGGIEILNRALEPLARIAPGREGLPAGRVATLAQTLDGSVWAAVGNQLLRFDEHGRRRETISSGTAVVRRIQPTSDGGFWAATLDGLMRWTPAGGRLVAVDIAGTTGSVGELNSFATDADGSLWVGGGTGIVRIRQPASDHAVAQLVPTRGLGQTVLGLATDAEGRLWADTSAGLHRLVEVDGPRLRFEAVAAGTGAFGANLLVDRHGRLWTQRAVFDPRSGERRDLGPADGADLGTGWFRAYAALDDGRLLFGGARGLLVVEPDRYAPWSYEPPVVATELRVGGLPTPLPAADGGLVLAPGQRSLQLGFAALDYSQPGRNRYRYRLEGLDNDWQEAGALARSAAYTNLEPGRYVLRVQGSNRVGTWSPRELKLPVEVQAAWWQKTGLRAAAVLLGALLILGAVRLRVRLLLKRQAELEGHVAAATAALQQKSLELEEASLTDPLTGLRNRRFLDQHLPGDVALAVRRHEGTESYGHETADAGSAEDAELLFFLVDVDHFKRINDRHGHTAGDAVLTQMRGRLQQVFRATDYLVRWGGEEFLIVARGTPRARAAELAERARQAIAAQPFELDGGERLVLSCSVGFSAFPLCPARPRALDWRTAIDLADAALYQAKKAGRDAWVGLLEAEAAGDEALRADLRLALADWAASGRLRLQQSR
jgi:diguanylate cyclase (GGDEF)-like protein